MLVEGIPIRSETGHVAARRLLGQMYRQYTGQPMPEILVTDAGKPYWPGSPLHFSITHTRRHAFCAISETPVGIDAEELDRQVNLRLAEKILSPGELAQFREAADPNRALLTFWVLKEAGAKCTGDGLQGYPNGTDYSLDDPRVTVRDGCLLAVVRQDDQQEAAYAL